MARRFASWPLPHWTGAPMVHFDHAMLGATLTVALGALRRYGWPVVLFGAVVGAAPDWDAFPKHFSTSLYEQGHRVWGHNLFAATLAGLILGYLGWLIHRSRQKSEPKSTPTYWLALSVLILWTHPLFDLLYCGLEREADWPVRLFWPISERGYGQPWVPWHDWGATGILASGLVLIAFVRPTRQTIAAGTLTVLAVYVGARGLLSR